MRICLILEGCYPYVRGGVSSWTDNYIREFSEHEIALWLVGAEKEKRGQFQYSLPPNVVEVEELFLDEAFDLEEEAQHPKTALTAAEIEMVKRLILCEEPNWSVLFRCYNERQVNPISFLKSEEFLRLLQGLGMERYRHMAFSDLFFTLRSMILPLLFVMAAKVPQADVYHAIATGYSGVLGALGAWKYDAPLLVTEHGIYTREREEEILRSKWVDSSHKDMWVAFFVMLSRCAYQSAQYVTCLYEHAREMQIDLGCPAHKCRVINNGIDASRFSEIPPKDFNGSIDIGAVVRIAPIKDIMTMIFAFAELKQTIPEARLHILGHVDDEEYNAECLSLVKQLAVDDILFVGSTDVMAYMRNLDFVILTSISEAQPLAIIEAMAAGRPCVVTDVGSCRELVAGGGNDVVGESGLCVPPMHPQALAEAMRFICLNPHIAVTMGSIGKQRVAKRYTHDRMIREYRNLYEGLNF